MRRRSRAGQAGVTLLELMIATAVMGIVMFTLSSLFHAVMRLWVLGAADAEMIQRSRAALVRISEDIQTALPPYGEVDSEFIGVNNTNAAMTDSVSDEIHFFGNTYNFKEGQTPTDDQRCGEIVRFGYWLKKPSGEDSRIQLRKITGSIGDSMPDGATSLLTVGAGGGGASFSYYVGDFQVEYYSALTGLWYTEWDSRSTGGITGSTYDDDRLPALVRVTVQMQDPLGRIDPQWFSIAVKPGATQSVGSFLESNFP